MSSHQQLVERLFDLTTRGETDRAEFTQLDALVYGRLVHTYGDDEVFEAGIQATPPAFTHHARVAEAA